MPRRSNATGYTGMRERPGGAFYAEIRSGLKRIKLGTYEAARAYDAEDLAPPPCLVTAEDRCHHKALQRRLYHVVEDECLMEEWKRRLPEDVQAMHAFYVECTGA
ncbi:uncharacterized protein [Lolium perenne]|uniref:uncharacterized protein n=1 Tax=Lolium perenne TaxID=4522 RepID=UPI0021F5EEA6|nr:uncharacterized protein LOC127303129 [Lolium perenne]